MSGSARAYDSSTRRDMARQRRRAVLDAARELLERDGYPGLTIKAVAARAGVSPELVYKIGNRQRLVKQVYDLAVAGDDEPVPVGQRPEIRAIWALADVPEKIERYAAFVTALHGRVGDLLAVLADNDPEVAEVRAATEEERLAGVGAFVEHLDTRDETAVDGAWALTSPQVYVQLTRGRGWSQDAYRAWLARMLRATLLDVSSSG